MSRNWLRALTIVMLLLTAVMSRTVLRDEESRKNAATRQSAVSFVAEMDAMLHGEWSVVGTYARKQGGETKLEQGWQEKRRRDDTYRQIGGRIAVSKDGKSYVCATQAPDGERLAKPQCGEGVATQSADETLRTVRENVLGENPRYVVSREGEDFVLAHHSGEQDPNWGSWVSLRFDEQTHAPRIQKFRRGPYVDVLETTRVRTDVSDADFSLPGAL